jgi:aryl-alcohol dehydrogenase-like predicted oxidoreductase
VAYSPLGRGFFGGTITTESEWDPKDVRRHLPRFQGENLARNVALRDRMDTLARGKHCTASQLAIAWVLAKRPFVVPIPGTKRIRYLEENAQAAAVELTAADVAALDEMFPRGGAAGERYPPASMRLVETESSS